MYKSTKPLSKKKKTDVELSRIIAVSVTDIVRDSLNPTFRQTYFDTVGVMNTTDAQYSIENRLLNLLDLNKFCEEKCVNNDETILENYIASKILRSTDAKNIYKHTEMVSLINHLLKIDSKLDGQITKTNDFISTNVLSCNILKNME